MPAHPRPLEVKTPKRKKDGWTDAQWAFPQRLVDLARERGWSRKRIEAIAQVSQATVSRWISYKAQQPDVEALKRLEKAGEKPLGWLLRDPSDETSPLTDGVSTQLGDRLLRLGLNDELVTLTDEELGVVERFRPEVRKAILGIVHVYDVPLERAAAIASEAVKAEPHMLGNPSGNAPFWFERMARKIPDRKESGSFPSSSSIKIVK